MAEKTDLFLIKCKGGNFKSFKELQDYADKQYDVLQTALIENKNLQTKVEHLEALLASAIDAEDDNTVKIIKSPAECLIDAQLEQLQQIGLQRKLTLDETRQLDLLIKNQRLLTGKSTAIEAESKKLPKEVDKLSNQQLINIVKLPDKSKE